MKPVEEQSSEREKKLTDQQLIERSIIKTYRKSLWNKFVAALKEYELVLEGDHIMCCLSGGKDSALLAKCFQQLERISTVNFKVEYVVMDPGFTSIDRKKIEDNCARLGIPAQFFSTDIYRIVKNMEDAPCYMCARMRRGNLYSHAASLGCNKIALGHHMDDVVETLLMSMFYGSEIKTMPPKLHSSNFENMELIRPLYQIQEKDIILWRNLHKLEFIHCGCPLSETNCSVSEVHGSKRAETKDLLNQLKKTNPSIVQNVFSSIHNVNLNTFPTYTFFGKKHSFLENYTEGEDVVAM